MKNKNQTVYFVSESTGITAESLANSLLSQFPNVDFIRLHRPFINTPEKANELANECAIVKNTSGFKPLMFITMPDKKISLILKDAPCHYYELFTPHVDKIAQDIGIKPTHGSGITHGLINHQSYDERMDIVNFALTHDDAMTFKNLDAADVILLGVSRSGKTPTCLYLALHFGIRAANYPLTEDDFIKDDIPQVLKANKHKLIGLTITANRLSSIRVKRRTGSSYATLTKCRSEINYALELFERYQLDVFDTTSSSIEELSTRIMQVVKSKRTDPYIKGTSII